MCCVAIEQRRLQMHAMSLESACDGKGHVTGAAGDIEEFDALHLKLARDAPKQVLTGADAAKPAIYALEIGQSFGNFLRCSGIAIQQLGANRALHQQLG